MASVSAIKNIPPRVPIPDFESILLANPLGNPISKYPKNEIAKNTNIKKNTMFSHTFAEMLFSISGLTLLTEVWDQQRSCSALISYPAVI